VSLLAHLSVLARRRPHDVVLRSGTKAIDRADLEVQVGRLADRLAALDLARVSTAFDNGIEAVVVSLALRAIGAAQVPLPGFFSPAQCAHAQAAADVEAHLDAGLSGTALLPGIHLHPRQPARAAALPVGTSVVTFTSGSTGTPKGVCLSASHLETVSTAIVDALAGQTPRRHLALLPLAVLLEQVAGVEAALWAEAEVLLPASADTGLVGAAGLDPAQLAACIDQSRPESLILVPQMLQGWLWALGQGARAPDSLRFAAVGGARVPPALLQAAAGFGLPVYEGYGLSECASVVCLNRPDASRDGSVGRALPHVRIEVDGAGEVLVHGPCFLGYLGEAPMAPGPLATGDLGRLDESGFLAIDGRRRNVYITAFGRNVSPEWVESELLAEPEIAHVVVDGEARAETVAIIAPARSGLGDGEIATAIARANARLPDYARVHRWLRAREAFSAGNGLLTGNGRVRRAEVLARHAADLPLRAGA
jgi:long-chain acyl-CoA synthetase